MTWAAALLALGVFIALARWLGMGKMSRDAFAQLAAALRVMRDPDLDDDAKEPLVRRHAARLLALFAHLALTSALVLTIPATGLWLLTQSGSVPGDELLTLLASWQFLVAAVGVTWLATRLSGAAPR